MFRNKLFFAILLLVSTVLVAQTGFRIKTRSTAELNAEQRNVVGSYCRFDFEGARLKEGGWSKLEPWTGKKSNPDFQSIVLVSRYQVIPNEMAAWDVQVNYTTIGRFDLNAGFTPDAGMESVVFRTKDVDGTLEIVGIEPDAPHVSKRAALEWMKQLAADPKQTDVHRRHLQDAIRVLEPPASTATEKP